MTTTPDLNDQRRQGRAFEPKGEVVSLRRGTNGTAARASKSTEPDGRWRDRLTRGKRGEVKSTIANATLVLQCDPVWAGVLGYDERTEQPTLIARPPFSDLPANLQRTPRQLVDGDDVRTIQWLERAHGISLSTANVHAAINAVAELKPFDRVREYLEQRAWDGIERLNTWTAQYLGATDTTYARAVGKRWMISAVARTFEPGVKADHVLVLEGLQGIGKSTALQILAGDDYFGDDVPAIGSKDAQQYLGALWIVELAEMDAASRAEAATLKRFLTTSTDYYRPPYGRRMIAHPRHCVFAGSVNLEEYLHDSTGGRRFWPIKCGVIDLAALRRDRDALWAEAIAAYRGGEPWHLDDPELVKSARLEQGARLESDPWEEALGKYLERTTETFVTTPTLLEHAIKLELGKTSKREALRVGAIMRRLSWKYGEGPARQRGWFRPGGEQP